MSIEQWLAERGVILRFKIDGASLNLAEKATDRVPRSMALRLRIEGHDDIRLSNKRSLKKVEWCMYLEEGSTFNEYATKLGGIGVLSHYEASEPDDDYPQPESCHISAALKPDKFLSLVQAIQSGRSPESVSVTIRGIKYGWEPDGSGKEWDEKQIPVPPVIELSFHLPLFGLQSESVEEETPSRVPASAADIQSLRSAIAEQSAALRATIWKVFWAAVVVAVALWLAK